MYDTKYHRASSLDEAAKIFASADDGAFLSGGQTLLPTMKQRLAAPSDLVDLTHIDGLSGVSVDGDTVKIGGLTTHYEVNQDNALSKACPALARMAGWIGDPQVRHRGTIGGSLANNDPAADYPAAMLALNATIHTNKREIAADDFFTGMFETALEEGEIVTAVSFKSVDKCGYEKFRNPASRYAMAGVFAAKAKDGSVRIGVTGAGDDGVFRWTEAEEALASNWSADALDSCDVDSSGLMSDIHASAAYRANLVKVMTKRAVSSAD
ncbi:FAD binding domain-containing protein [Ahrensia marina]|uniref:Carbon monoxide dehydrogenase n=1 Tax=Ahrensia marina TaxID=1514904 RepID=A0A0N1J6C3_9HYPH|nr:xanthine dehydrogenase family protein subunit M [Ahrensia marina]KPB00578.1 carbon monoxide dehydrogenase [Ahrensia marina]